MRLQSLGLVHPQEARDGVLPKIPLNFDGRASVMSYSRARPAKRLERNRAAKIGDP